MGKRAKAGRKSRTRTSKPKPRPKARGAKTKRKTRSRLELDNLRRILPPVKLALTALLLLALPLLIYLGNTEYGYTKSIFALFFISFLLILWGLEAVLHRDYRINLTPLFLPGVILLGVAALSMVNATSLGVSLQSLVLLLYFFLFYLFIANTVQFEWQIKLCLGSILAAASLAAIYGILQYFQILPGAPGQPGGTGAIISSLGNKNYLGGFIVYLVIPSLVLLFCAQSWILRGFTLLGLATIIFTLALIKSDGVWLALAVSGAFLIGGFLYFKLHRAFKIKQGWPIFVILPLLLLSPLLGPKDSPEVAYRDWASLQSGPLVEMYGEASNPNLDHPLAASSFSSDLLGRLLKRIQDRTRSWDWWVGWEMLKDRPLLGVGLGHYKVQFLPYKAKFLATPQGEHYDFYIRRAAQAHNEYVQMAAEMGILGILAGVFALFMIFFSAFKLIGRAEAGDRFMILALLAGVVAFLTHAVVSFPLHLPASALDLILLLSLLNSKYFVQKSKVQSPKIMDIGHWTLDIGPSFRRRGGWAMLAIALVLGISVSTLAYRDWLADTYLDRGERDLKLGKVDVAKVELEHSFKLDFQPRKVLYWLGSIYHKLGEEQSDGELLHRSLEILEKSLSSFQVEATYLQLAQLYLNRGEYDRAMDYLNRLLAMSPEPERGLDAQYLVAVVERERGNPDKALQVLNELISKHKDYERAYVLRAKVYLDQGSDGLARLDLKEALNIASEKLDRSHRRLQALHEGGRLTLDLYSQLQSEIDRLKAEKESLEKLLQELAG